MKRAKVLEEAKRAFATPMDELEESATNAEESAELMMIEAEGAFTETRETFEALTVSVLQQAHEIDHRPEKTAESFFQTHKDMTVTSKEQARQKQLDFLESMKSLRRGVRGRVACWNTRRVRPLGRHNGNSNNVETQMHCERHEEPHSDEGCFAVTGALGKVSRQTRSRTRKFCGRQHTSFPHR